MLTDKQKGILELSIAAVFWGFGFIATTWVLQTLNAESTVFVRYLIASLIGLFIFLLPQYRKKWALKEFFQSAIPAIFLFLNLYLQTWGLQSTTATKSAFITCLYVFWVPILNYVIFKNKISLKIFLFAFVAIIGTALMVNLNISDWNLGDTLTLLCSVGAGLHILSVGRYAPNASSSFLFNLYQSFWTALFAFLLILIQSRFDGLLAIFNTIQNNENIYLWPGLLALAIGSTLIAFSFQVRAQKVVDPSIASILFLAEAPLASIFGYFILNQNISLMQMSGCLLIFLSCYWAAKNS